MFYKSKANPDDVKPGAKHEPARRPAPDFDEAVAFAVRVGVGPDRAFPLAAKPDALVHVESVDELGLETKFTAAH